MLKKYHFVRDDEEYRDFFKVVTLEEIIHYVNYMVLELDYFLTGCNDPKDSISHYIPTIYLPMGKDRKPELTRSSDVTIVLERVTQGCPPKIRSLKAATSPLYAGQGTIQIENKKIILFLGSRRFTYHTTHALAKAEQIISQLICDPKVDL